MKRWGGHSRLIVFHGKMLPVKASANVGSMGIQRCNNFILFNAQTFKAILLCGWTEIGFFRHYKPSGVVFGSVHLLCKGINSLLRVSTQHDIPGKFVVNFRNQLVLVSPNSFGKIVPVSRPRFSKHLFNLRLIQSGNIPTNIEPVLKFIRCVIVPTFKGIRQSPVHSTELLCIHDFKAVLCLYFQGFQLWNVVLCRSVFKFFHPTTV